MAKWTLAKCKKIAKKYTRRSDFQKGDRAAEGAARYHGWMEEVCAHMEPVPERIKKRAKAGTWTREMMAESAMRFNVTLEEWRLGEPKAYYAAFNRRIHTDIADARLAGSLGTTRKKVPVGHWKDPMNCLIEARKYKTKAEWERVTDPHTARPTSTATLMFARGTWRAAPQLTTTPCTAGRLSTISVQPASTRSA